MSVHHITIFVMSFIKPIKPNFQKLEKKPQFVSVVKWMNVSVISDVILALKTCSNIILF